MSNIRHPPQCRPTRDRRSNDRPQMDKYVQLQKKMARIIAVVNAQAGDEGLWFVAEFITESHLQQALRELHLAIEND